MSASENDDRFPDVLYGRKHNIAVLVGHQDPLRGVLATKGDAVSTDIPTEHRNEWRAAEEALRRAVERHCDAIRKLHEAAILRARGQAIRDPGAYPTGTDMFLASDAVRDAERAVQDAGRPLYALVDKVHAQGKP